MSEPRGIVCVVDDDESVREAIASLVRSVRLDVRTFESAQEFLAAEPLDAPSCLVLDVRLPGSSGLDLQRDLRAAGATVPIIFLTGYGDVPMTVRAMRAGAIEFLIKPFRDQELLDAIQQGLERSRTERREQAELAELQRRFESLTPRERQVMAEVVAGLPNKKIAAGFGTSEATIKLQRGQVMQKMQAGSLAELVRLAARLGDWRAPE
ncbi:MAG TPA: response regulator [Myxococcota bacterium]|nr:response regulator [Myxococcota bacterium]